MRNHKAPEVLDLVVRARDGDRAAFGDLYSLIGPSVRAAIRAKFPAWDSADVEDVAQETWLNALEKLDTQRKTGGFEGWICSIARNKAIDRHRKEGLRTGTPLSDVELVATVRGALDRLAENEAVTQALDRLPRNQVEVVMLIFKEGFTCSGVAALLGISPSTVSCRLRCARDSLRGYFNSEDPERES
ncbi:MAG: RNA polymerase sigma factor [Myxococcales bacterium]|nr:RNA polymerase sigma factor [Myxococcales bacterium]